MARVRGRDSPAQILASLVIRVPEHILAIREIDPRLTDRDVEPVIFEGLQESHFNIQIVLPKRVVNHLRTPRRHIPLGDRFIGPPKFCRGAPTDAGDLADPPSFHLIAIFSDGNLSERFAVNRDIFSARGRSAQTRAQQRGGAKSKGDKNFIHYKLPSIVLRRQKKSEVRSPPRSHCIRNERKKQIIKKKARQKTRRAP